MITTVLAFLLTLGLLVVVQGAVDMGEQIAFQFFDRTLEAAVDDRHRHMVGAFNQAADTRWQPHLRKPGEWRGFQHRVDAATHHGCKGRGAEVPDSRGAGAQD